MEQLKLLDPSAGAGSSDQNDGENPQGPKPWQLDERTRSIGRQGLASARRALSRSAARRAA